MVSSFIIYLMGFQKVIQSGEYIISDGLSWVGMEFLLSGGVGQMFLNLINVKTAVHEAYSATLIKRFDD